MSNVQKLWYAIGLERLVSLSNRSIWQYGSANGNIAS